MQLGSTKLTNRSWASSVSLKKLLSLPSYSDISDLSFVDTPGFASMIADSRS
jgi:hypothetical protein